MVRNKEKNGFTLIEMMVVVAIVATLAVFGMPAVRTLVNAFHTDGGTRAMISSALSCARSMAMREQTYAGVRFQKAYTTGDLLDAPQYMVFIIYDPCLSNLQTGNIGCRAMEGMEPIKLPESTGVTDLMVGSQTPNRQAQNSDLVNDAGLYDITTFSVLFSPSGKLIIHNLWVVNRNRYTPTATGSDDIFNTAANVNVGIGSFIQDEQVTDGTGRQIEASRNSFIIYDAKILKQTDKNNRFAKYLQTLENTRAYINPYMGTLINK